MNRRRGKHHTLANESWQSDVACLVYSCVANPMQRHRGTQQNDQTHNEMCPLAIQRLTGAEQHRVDQESRGDHGHQTAADRVFAADHDPLCFQSLLNRLPS